MPPAAANVYAPRGSALEVLKAKDPEVLLSGPAGTGKSRACLEKLNAVAIKYPGSRQLIIRKTRESLTESGLVTFEEHVRPWCPTHSVQRRMRQAYRYPNGSEIVVGGIDKPGKIMSTEFDTIYVQEATELTKDDWESLNTRLRNGVVPYQQLIADCNPAQPTHWLKQRVDAGATRMIPCRHEDNPRWYDPTTNEWTREGRNYIEKLDRLTGVRYLRLRKGLWAAAEGIVYDDWDAGLHHVTLKDLGLESIPPEWRRFRVVDFGFTNPFVCQWWALDPDGRMYLYREIYWTQRLVEDHARQIREYSIGEAIEATVADHDAEDRATLAKHGVPTIPAEKSVSPGIQEMQGRFRKAGDGRPRLYVIQGCTIARDARLVEAGLPAATVEEVDGYVWGDNAKKEAPVKENDHGMDAARYACMYASRARSPWGARGTQAG
jgi:PBSX family phage terminase large subunit